MKRFTIFAMIAVLVLGAAIFLGACSGGGGGGSSSSSSSSSGGSTTYTVSYNGNGSTGGTVPVDATNYAAGQTVTVLGNTGSLAYTGYSFLGWNTLSNGTGTTYTPGQTFTMGTADVSLYADWIIGFAYVANSGDGTVSQYTIGMDGTLSAITPSTVAAGSGPYSVTVDPSGKYAYVANEYDNTVSQYTIGADGSLTSMATATVAAGTNPWSVTVDPKGPYVYVADSNASLSGTGVSGISQYTIGSNGALTPMSPAIVAAGNVPYVVTVDPTGKYVYVANDSPSLTPSTTFLVSQYTIGTNGALTPMSPATVEVGGMYPTSITVDPSGKYAYVTNFGGNVAQYTIGTGGTLSAMTPSTVAAGSEPTSVAVDPSSKYAYVTNSNDNTVSQYTIGTDGALTPMSPPTVATETSPNSVTVDPSGKYAYVANVSSDNIAQYRIDTNGVLTLLSQPTVPAGTGPWSIITTVDKQPSPAANSGIWDLSEWDNAQWGT